MASTGTDRTLDALSAAIVRILRPLVRVLLRHGVPFAAFADLAKRVYVEIAAAEFPVGRRKQSASRIAVITGLTRKEVRRVSELPAVSAREETDRYNRAARVITGWVADPRFQDERGQPRPLETETEFTELVRAFSGDMPARAILDELLRVGAVLRDDDGHVRLGVRAYVPAAAGADKLEILGADVAALASTIDHNIDCAPGQAWFQRKVLYDNLPEEAVPVLRLLAAEQAQQLLESLNLEMSARDRDCNPSVEGNGRRTAMVGIYWHECDTALPDGGGTE